MKKSILYFGLSFFLFSVPSIVGAQTNNVEEKVKTQTTNRANNKVDQGINNGLNTAEGGFDSGVNAVGNEVKNLFKKKKPTGEQSSAENQPTQQEGVNDAPTTDEPSLQSYSKFDFVPGEKVVFYEDFTQDAIGDFPALWNTNGSGEVVTTNIYSGNWLRYVMDESIWTDKLLSLPDNYTLEFDVVPIEGTEGGMGGWSFRLMKSINEKSWDGGAVPGKAGFQYGVEYFGRSYYRAYNNELDGEFWDQKGYKDDEDTYQKKTGYTICQCGCRKQGSEYIRTKSRCSMCHAHFLILP